MYRCRLFACIWVGAALGLSGAAVAQDAQFGSEEDVTYSGAIWSAMEEAGLAGEGAVHVKGYEGQEPHGAILETLHTNLEVDGTEDQLIIKRNYMGDGVSPSAVWEDPESFFDTVTVMFEDPEAESGWFWAKYLPDGTLDTAPNDLQMAGQVAGCISCHGDAEGGDMVFSND